MNKYLRSLGEYIDDQFRAHPRITLMIVIIVAFALSSQL